MSEPKQQTQEEVSRVVDDLDENIHEMTEKDFIRVIRGNSAEAFALRRKRKNVRYRLSRIQTMFLGGPDAEDHTNLKGMFEAMPTFPQDGWRWYGTTWDVSLDDPLRIVRRDMSKEEEWDQIIKAKFPTLDPATGRVTYPDFSVKEKVEAQAKEDRK